MTEQATRLHCDPAKRHDFVLVFDVTDGNPNVWNLGSYPKTLTMERQGLFALGYYHQRARNRAAARAASEARENNSENPNPDGEES